MGTIKKLQNGKYLLDIYDKNGKRQRLRFPNLKYARAYNTNIEQEKIDQKLVTYGLKKERVKLCDAIEEFMETKEDLRSKSLVKYQNIVNQFYRFTQLLKLTYIDEFTREHADKYKVELKNTDASSKTINTYLQVVKAMFTYQVRKDRLIKNPFDHLTFLREKHKSLIEREVDYYNKNEIKMFFEQKMEEVYRNAFTGLFLTGCRFEELANLKWKYNIDFDNKLIKIRSNDGFEVKTRSSERNIPMTNHIYKLLQRIERNKNSEYVFPSIKNSKLSERTLLTCCKRIAKQAGISKVATLHKWRHTFTSMAERVGISYEKREYLMGHAPKSMTDRYTKVEVKELHSVLSKLDDYIPQN